MPQSESDNNITANLQLDSFTLTDAELAQINALNKNHRHGGVPDNAGQANLNNPAASR
ncbi:hypothetical protein IT774_14305 [Salinimonas marina]|uniref:Uncharacterized protein n=1 Tax=Salinimonas marina TaxID=2785918 RepID=A0A7S9HCK6_9ALTE|nr:hypothetical protein [Salinimonas marina]QPG05270.1 hypothetical protein IT774_14305 [Salinimonas marina]